MKGDESVQRRYEELGLSDALFRGYDYPSACHELGLILRLAYGKLPKPLQALVVRDTLAAFRLLPQVHTQCGLSSATVLLQAAEAALPKQKKALAVSEFKHAVVAHKRMYKTQQNGGFIHLPHDVMVHIFSYLDVRSLVTASLVCWAWNLAAKENVIWEKLYDLLFEKGDIFTYVKRKGEVVSQKNGMIFHENIEQDQMVDWRKAFESKYKGERSWKLAEKSNRLKCVQCKSIIWFNSITSSATSHTCVDLKDQKLNVRPISSTEVLGYLLGESDSSTSSDSDDSDTDIVSLGPQRGLPKLWAYPRLMVRD